MRTLVDSMRVNADVWATENSAVCQLCGVMENPKDAVGWVIRPIKPVPNMTYNVFTGTLNCLESINQKCHFLPVGDLGPI